MYFLIELYSQSPYNLLWAYLRNSQQRMRDTYSYDAGSGDLSFRHYLPDSFNVIYNSFNGIV